MKSKLYRELQLRYVSRNVSRFFVILALALACVWFYRTMNETNNLLTVMVCHDLNDNEQAMLSCINNE